MAPSKWDDEEDSVSFGSDSDTSPPPPTIARRGKFDDEEGDADVLDSWDAAEDSEVEREKEKKAAEAKAKAEAEAKANKKSRAQRIEEKREQARLRRELEGIEESEDEDINDRLARMRQEEKDNDLKHAEDLFGDSGVDVDVDRKSNSITIKADPPKPKAKPAEPKDIFSGIGVNPNRANAKAVVNIADPNNEGNTIDLASLKLFNPVGKPGFDKLRDTLVPLLTQTAKKPQYASFMQEFAKALVRDLPSDQIKKVASGLTTLSNEKMKEEKAAEKGGKKSKAAKTKTTLNAARDTAYKADTEIYDDGLDDGDFM